MKKLHLPLPPKDIVSLHAGQRVFLSGELITARDQAHKRLIELISKRKKIPINLARSTIFYCGPTPPPPGKIIGACGPTTAARMDPFTPMLIRRGLRVMIGKGNRNREVIATIKKYRGVYFVTYGGCGAYLQAKVKARKVVTFADLGPEAVYSLRVQDFPVVVAVDSRGRSILD